ncbi:MAG: hypothetical protein COA79_20020 [Planctomycetota bacterium]|nr:MAG: hypothetical protein COA79_20020 [Planctomycetota bacterium]
MKINTLLEKKYKEGAHGISWALKNLEVKEKGDALFCKDKELNLISDKSIKGDSYQLIFSKTSITLKSNTVVGVISGLFRLKEKLNLKDSSNENTQLKFKTRFYKHELRYKGLGSRNAWDQPDITMYTKEFMEELIQYIVTKGFNAMVLYSGYHPFQSFLDYKGFEHGINTPKKLRKENFDGLSMLLTLAKQYGLRTYLHHYVTHFTQALSDHLKLGMKEGKLRLANFEHPQIDEYNRYIYKRTLETLPQLTGFFLNFESSGNAIAFMDRTLWKVAEKMKNKPSLYIRLWGLSDVQGLKSLFKKYKGHKGLVHKGHETNDVVYYPVADDRVKVWKKAMPDVEFTFSIGPCHNCSTNICDKLWTDPKYVHDLLKSMQDKGADSISFQSAREISLSFLKSGKKIYDPVLLAKSRMNQGHIDAVLDYVNDRKISEKEWVQRYEGYFKTSEGVAKHIKKAIFESSQIILLQFQQFCYGSPQEGYSYNGRFSFYQEPFFYYPMSFLNRIGEIKVNYTWRPWVVRDTKIKVVPNDTLAVIDYVNPAVKQKVSHHPDKIIAEIKSHAREGMKALQLYKKAAGKKVDKIFVQHVFDNCNFGERIWREIEIQKSLYSCYFAKTKASFFNHLKNANSLMVESAKKVDIDATRAFHCTTQNNKYTPGIDALAIEKIISYEKEDIPFKALQHYLNSHVHYNEIRRLSRAYVSIEDEMKKRNLGLLDKAMKEVDKSIECLQNVKHSLYLNNVLSWRDYLRYEVDALTPPTMICSKDDKDQADKDFRTMYHDQNYRWGEFCWEDFSSFFRYQNFFGVDHMDCKTTYTDKGLKISMREHDINWSERDAVWKENEGSINQTGFMQIMLDTSSNASEMQRFTLYFKGKGGMKAKSGVLANGKKAGGKPGVFKEYKCTFEHTDSNWRFDVIIPWKELGRKPKKGDVWLFNVFSNPSVIKNRRVIWAQGFECKGDRVRLGRIVF